MEFIPPLPPLPLRMTDEFDIPLGPIHPIGTHEVILERPRER